MNGKTKKSQATESAVKVEAFHNAMRLDISNTGSHMATLIDQLQHSQF